jgi:hypothetical protein
VLMLQGGVLYRTGARRLWVLIKNNTCRNKTSDSKPGYVLICRLSAGAAVPSQPVGYESARMPCSISLFVVMGGAPDVVS